MGNADFARLGLYVASLENNWEYKSVDPTFALRIGFIYPAYPAKTNTYSFSCRCLIQMLWSSVLFLGPQAKRCSRSKTLRAFKSEKVNNDDFPCSKATVNTTVFQNARFRLVIGFDIWLLETGQLCLFFINKGQFLLKKSSMSTKAKDQEPL